MIARVWRGWAPRATAADYQRHYESEVKDHLRAVSGFRGARLLRRDDDQEVMFTSITFFASLDAIRDFAGTITSWRSSRRPHGGPCAGGTSASPATR
jgi:heme-degrading monooxygenase HmoA